MEIAAYWWANLGTSYVGISQETKPGIGWPMTVNLINWWNHEQVNSGKSKRGTKVIENVRRVRMERATSHQSLFSRP